MEALTSILEVTPIGWVINNGAQLAPFAMFTFYGVKQTVIDYRRKYGRFSQYLTVEAK